MPKPKLNIEMSFYLQGRRFDVESTPQGTYVVREWRNSVDSKVLPLPPPCEQSVGGCCYALLRHLEYEEELSCAS